MALPAKVTNRFISRLYMVSPPFLLNSFLGRFLCKQSLYSLVEYSSFTFCIVPYLFVKLGIFVK